MVVVLCEKETDKQLWNADCDSIDLICWMLDATPDKR